LQKKKYKLKGELWIYPGETANWHFLSIPKKEAREISANFNHLKRGWGSFPVEVKIRETKWKTSIFPDKKSGTYLLPIKASIRKKENIRAGEKVEFSMVILL